MKPEQQPGSGSTAPLDPKEYVSLPLALIAWPAVSAEALEALARECLRLARRMKRERPPGKPASQEVTKALELRSNGVPWHRVYWAVLPGYASMGSDAQHLTRDRLRDAVRKRRKANTKETAHRTTAPE